MTVSLRPATARDQPLIRALVLSEQINPFDLNWRRFTVAEDADGHVVGCGQLRRHGDVHEMASIVVRPECQGHGVGRLLVNALIAEATGPLWLMCESHLCPLYKKFGFSEVKAASSMPAYFRFQQWTSVPLLNLYLAPRGRYVAVMKRTAASQAG